MKITPVRSGGYAILFTLTAILMMQGIPEIAEADIAAGFFGLFLLLIFISLACYHDYCFITQLLHSIKKESYLKKETERRICYLEGRGKKKLSPEMKESMDRLSHLDYLNALAKNGISIPTCFLNRAQTATIARVTPSPKTIISHISTPAEKLFCRRCGAQLPADSDSCPKCGTAVIH